MLMISNNVIITSIIMSLIVASLVWLNAPLEATPYSKGKSLVVFMKAFIISFFITFVIFYFTNDNGTDEVIDNIIKGKADF